MSNLYDAVDDAFRGELDALVSASRLDTLDRVLVALDLAVTTRKAVLSDADTDSRLREKLSIEVDALLKMQSWVNQFRKETEWEIRKNER